VRSRLVHFFNQCRGLKHNAAKGVPIRNIQRIKRKLDGDAVPHLHLDEIERLYALPLDLFTLKHRAIYALGIYTGLRGGEIVGLEWPSIVRLYGERPEIHVRSSYNLLTKTQSSQREVPMLPQPVQHLQAYCDSLGARPITGLVFPNPFGGHYARGWSAGWYTTDRKDYRPRKTAVRFQKRGTRSDVGFRELAKIRDHILYKHLRHTCATQLRAGHFTADRWSADMVARLLGHTDVKMQSHYVSSGVADLHEYLETNKPKVIG
jgi:integrase